MNRNRRFIVVGRQELEDASIPPLSLAEWGTSTLEEDMSRLAHFAMTHNDEGQEDSVFHAVAVRHVDPVTADIQSGLLVQGWTTNRAPNGMMRTLGVCVMRFTQQPGMAGSVLTSQVEAGNVGGGDYIQTLRIQRTDDQIALGQVTMNALSTDVTSPELVRDFVTASVRANLGVQ